MQNLRGFPKSKFVLFCHVNMTKNDQKCWPQNRTRGDKNQIFRTKAERNDVILKHIAAVHEKLRPFPCHICNKTFSQKGAVNKHVLIVHEGKIPSFQCETCGKNFTAKAKLKSHVLTVHEGVKPYKCDYENCEAAFTGKQNLEGHILTVHKGQ